LRLYPRRPLWGARVQVETIRRKVLTFALVSQNFEGRADPLTALFPLFAPIASDRAGSLFDPDVFQSDMRDRYGLVLSRDVVDLFSQRLAQLRLLDRTGAAAVWSASSLPAHNNAPAEDEQSLNRLLTRAREFNSEKSDLFSIPFEEDKFLNALMNVVLDTQQSIQRAVGAISPGTEAPASGPVGPKIKDADQYFASSFVAWLKHKDSELFDWVASLAGAALVSESLVELRNPTLSTRVTPDLTVYLDTPFLMELLGCSGSAELEDAKLIFESLRSHGVGVSVLMHSIDELRFNLKGVLLADPRERRGPSAAAILAGEVSEVYLKSVLEDPEYFIRNIGISIANVKSSNHLLNMESFTSEDEHSFFASIQSYYNHPEAALRDAASVAWIMRRRKGEQARDVLKAKHILLTRNKLIYRVINRYCLEKGYVRKDTAGPVLLARDLAGVLWLISGSAERHAISQRQLLLSCQRARSNAPEIVSAMFRTLEQISKEGAELFWIAVQKPAYLSLALDTVASSGSGVSQQLVEETLDKIRDDLVAAERQKSRAALKATKDKHERDSALKEVVIQSLEKDRADLAESKLKLEASWRAFSDHEWKLRARTARWHWVVAIFALNGGALVLSSWGVVVGSDALNATTGVKVVIGILIVLSAQALVSLASTNWLRALVESAAQSRYLAEIDGRVPAECRQKALIEERMILGNAWSNFRAVISGGEPN
ncbi:MAG: hypothetical protein ACJ798_15650, partial [Phenylobacterium sp.]